MILTLSLHEHARHITLALTHKKQRWEGEAQNSEELIKALDKILKKAKIGINAVRKVQVTCPKETSLTSFRLATTFQQALTIVKAIKPRNPF